MLFLSTRISLVPAAAASPRRPPRGRVRSGRSPTAGVLPAIALIAGVLLIVQRIGAGQPDATTPELRTIGETPLAAGSGRFDVQSLDRQSHRLYIAHPGAGRVTVFDTWSKSIVGEIAGLAGVHGVIVAPDIGRVFATATGANLLVVIDAVSLSVLATAPAGDRPDSLAYVPDLGKLYVSGANGAAVVDVRTNARIAAISLDGEVGNTRYDFVTEHLYVTVQTRDQLTVIDPPADRIIARYDLPGCRQPRGLSLDTPRTRAFVACRGNATLIVVDPTNGRVLSSHPVGDGPDVLAFDARAGRLYVAAESGILTVFSVDDAGIREIARGSVGPNARSVAVDPDTHNIYLPLENDVGRPVLREILFERAG